MPEPLHFGALGITCAHVCVDMQRLFAEPTDWATPWMRRVLPQVVALVEANPERTVFTRFIPAREPGDGFGTWKRYYERWPNMTRERLPPDMVDLVPELQRYVPPALVVDKRVYGPWMGTGLHGQLRSRGIDTLVVSGAESEVCVLATVLGAVDLGYRVVLATDAVCSSADQTHDAIMEIYHNRYGTQVEPVLTEEILDAWR